MLAGKAIRKSTDRQEGRQDQEYTLQHSISHRASTALTTTGEATTTSSDQKASAQVCKDRLHSEIITIARVPLIIIIVAIISQGRAISHASSKGSTGRSSQGRTLQKTREDTMHGSREDTSLVSRGAISLGSREGTSLANRGAISLASRDSNTTDSMATATPEDSISHIRDRPESPTRNTSTLQTTIPMPSIA